MVLLAGSNEPHAAEDAAAGIPAGVVVHIKAPNGYDYLFLVLQAVGRVLQHIIEVGLARQDYRYLSTETIGGFCGVHIGNFAHTLTETISYADFDWTDFKFESNK